MKKIIVPILLLLTISFLSGCSIDWNDEKDKKISELNNEIIDLNNQISELNKKIDTFDLATQKLEFEKEKNEEAKIQEELKNKNKEKCLSEAHDRFVKEGNSLCLELGYSQDDIDNLKCRLPSNELKNIETKQTEAQEFCLKLYK